MTRRSWHGQDMVTSGDLERRHADVPLKRDRRTWLKYLKFGIEIDGELRPIPTREIQGILYTSIEAVWEVIGDAYESQLPRKRSRA